MIARNLDMMRGGNMRYQKTAAYGHFGRDDAGGSQIRVLMQRQLAWMLKVAQALQQVQQLVSFWSLLARWVFVQLVAVVGVVKWLVRWLCMTDSRPYFHLGRDDAGGGRRCNRIRFSF